MSAGFPELEDLYGVSSAPAKAVHAPSWPVYAAAAAALSSAVALVGAAQQQVLWGLVGYVLGAVVAPLLTVTHRLLRRTAHKDPFFVPSPRLERFIAVATGLGIVLGVVHAWFVATELAKQ